MKTLLWLLLCPLLLAAPADYGCSQPLRVDFFPFGLAYWRDDAGLQRGTDFELIQAVEQETGCKFQISELSRVLIWKKFEAGQTDWVLSALPTPERDRWGHFIALPYWGNRNQLVISKQIERPASPAAMLAHPELKLGVVRSYHYGDPIWDSLIAVQRQRGTLVEAADIEALYRLLKLGRINALISAPMRYRLLLARFDLQNQVDTVDFSPNEPPLRSGVYLSRQRFGRDELARWEALLNGPLHERFKRILTRHLGPVPAAEQP